MTATVTYEYQLRNPEPEIREFSLGVPNQPAVTEMSDGSFLATFDLTFGEDLISAHYDPDGSHVGDEHSIVDGTTSSAVVGSDVTGLSGGGAVAVWTDQSGPTSRVFGTLLGADGEPIENFSIGAGSSDTAVQVTALKDGGFVVSYQHTFLDADGSPDNDIKVEIRNADGSIRQLVTVDDSTVNDHNASATGLSNGGFVETFVRDDGEGGSSIQFRIFDANGKALTPVTLADNFGTGNIDPDVVALDKGGFAIAYADNGFGIDGTEITVKMFNADGTNRSDFVLANEGATAGFQLDPSLTVLKNGFLMVSWTDLDSDGTMFSVIDGDGNVVLEAQPMFGSADHVTETVLQALSNGDVVAIGTGHGDFGQTVIEGQLGHLIRNTFGDQFADNVVGDEIDDAMFGNGGDDRLNGAGGGDFLDGGDGADTLVGGSGSDHMSGGGGDDVYVVTEAGDLVIEKAGEGIDTVLTSRSFALDGFTHVEVLKALDADGKQAINLTGNFLENSLFGTDGSNVLDGGFGADRLVGRGGDDVYVVDDAHDVVVEAAKDGIDTVKSSVSHKLEANTEKLVLTGTGDINGQGNADANTLTGNAGDNVLNGLGGSDVLKGGAGDDVFVFNTGLGAKNVDDILGFRSPDDTIRLDDAIFKGLDVGTLGAGEFVIGTKALDANDHIIYDKATGSLFFDANGSAAGGQIEFATVAPGTNLSHDDFQIV